MDEVHEIEAKPKRTRRRSVQVTADQIIEQAKVEAAKIIASASGTGTTELERQAPNLNNERVWITLSENPNIPRGGQFFGVNGASFLLRPGKKAHVPVGLIDVLNNAVEGYPIVDPDTLQVVDWGQRLRYPYQVHAA